MGLYDNACDTKKGTPTLSKSSFVVSICLLSFTSHLLNQLFLTVSEVVRKFHIVGGTKVRLRGKGYDRGDGTFGDLIITYNVKLPDHLTDRQKELIEQMRREG